MAQINPYLTFNGTCEAAFDFYKSVFGTDYITKSRFSDGPPEMCPASERDKILHIALPVSDGYTLMGSDRPDSAGSGTMGDNISISINTGSEEEANKFFNGLSAGGAVTMPLQKTFWGALFGMLKDSFGVHWMVNYDYKQH